MAGIPKSFHSGFLNEEYGVLLLRQVAAVAQISRPEDHGIDAIATLLPAANGFLHAADTFLIQFKSQSVKVIEYGAPEEEAKGEVEWLRTLQVPLFFGSVSRMEDGDLGRLKIYCSQYLFGPLLLYPSITKIGVCFDDADAIPSTAHENAEKQRLRALAERIVFPSEADFGQWIGERWEEFIMSFPFTMWSLSVPIVEFGLAEIADPDYREHIIGVLQKWVRVGYENIQRAPIGMFDYMKWRTNEVPEIDRRQIHPEAPKRAKPNEIANILGNPLFVAMLERAYHGKRSDLDHILGVLDGYRRDGAPIDVAIDLVEQSWIRVEEYRRRYREERGLEP